MCFVRQWAANFTSDSGMARICCSCSWNLRYVFKLHVLDLSRKKSKSLCIFHADFLSVTVDFPEQLISGQVQVCKALALLFCEYVSALWGREISSFLAWCALDHKFGSIKFGCYTNLDVSVSIDCAVGTQPQYSNSRHLLSNKTPCLESCMIQTLYYVPVPLLLTDSHVFRLKLYTSHGINEK